MAVKLRLRRMGRKKRPVYAVVAADSRFARDGRYIEDLGRYEPLNEPAFVKLEDERILYWLGTGAQPSDTVRSLLSKSGLMLALHMKRKGASDEDIWAAVESHRAMRAEKEKENSKPTAADKRLSALAEEAKAADKKAAELAKARAEAEAKAQAEAEKAQLAAAAEREKAAAEAKLEQAASNEAQAAIEGAAEAPEAEAEAAPEAEAEAAPAAEAEAAPAAEAEAAPAAEAKAAPAAETQAAPEGEAKIEEG